MFIKSAIKGFSSHIIIIRGIIETSDSQPRVLEPQGVQLQPRQGFWQIMEIEIMVRLKKIYPHILI